jgi:hypothetical protein
MKESWVDIFVRSAIGPFVFVVIIVFGLLCIWMGYTGWGPAGAVVAVLIWGFMALWGTNVVLEFYREKR